MSEKPKTWRCPRCTMTFHAERPAYASGSAVTICAEPRCGVRFGHAVMKGVRTGRDTKPVRVWLEPARGARA